jgi:hypothetical protein
MAIPASNAAVLSNSCFLMDGPLPNGLRPRADPCEIGVSVQRKKRLKTVRSSDGARDFCDASSLSSIDSLGTITVSEIFRGRYAPAVLPLFSVALLRLRLLTPRGHDPFGSGHGSEIFLVYPTLSSTGVPSRRFLVPSEQAQTSLRLNLRTHGNRKRRELERQRRVWLKVCTYWDRYWATGIP